MVGRETIRKGAESFSSRLGQFHFQRARIKFESILFYEENYEEKKKYRLKTFSVRFEHVTFNFNYSTMKKRKEKKKKTALYRCIDKKSRGRKGSNLVVDASSNARKFPIFNYEFRAIRHSLLTSKHRLRIY